MNSVAINRSILCLYRPSTRDSREHLPQHLDYVYAAEAGVLSSYWNIERAAISSHFAEREGTALLDILANRHQRRGFKVSSIFFSFHFFLYFFLLFFLLSIHSLCQFTKHDVIYLFIYLFIFIEGAGGFGAERTDDVLRRFSRACGLHSEGLQLVRWHDRTSDAALHGASAGPGASQSQRWYQRKSTCPPLSTLPLSRPISHPSSSDIAFSRDKKFIHKIREVAIGARPYRYLYNHSLVLVSSFFSTLLF